MGSQPEQDEREPRTKTHDQPLAVCGKPMVYFQGPVRWCEECHNDYSNPAKSLACVSRGTPTSLLLRRDTRNYSELARPFGKLASQTRTKSSLHSP
jgi:hypothetical protein